MNKKYYILLIAILLIFNSSFAQEQKEERLNDYLYSEAYFDYLIECASAQKLEEEQEKLKAQEEEKISEIALSNEELEINIFDESEEDSSNVFKLHIEENVSTKPYKETFQIIDSKTIIPINDKFGFSQNVSKLRNKYSSDDYRLTTGIEINPFKILNIASGLETNYRGIDQNPNSRKLYFTPSIKLSDKLSVSFYNKYNITTKASDHDIGLKLSPFKSKAADFGVYAGVTKQSTGRTSESINFSTNIYLY